MSDEVMGPIEIGQLLGVSGSRVSQLAQEYEDFPEPAGQLSRGRVWRRADIVAWIALHPDRRPGRPTNPPPSTPADAS